MFKEIVKTKATSRARILLFRVLTGIFAFSLAFFLTPAYSKQQSLDIALVLDASGSMKKNDPNRLRVEAAKMFVHLLDRNDRVSVISFSSRAYPVTRLLSLDKKKNEDALLKGIDNMAANGKYTNLHDALSQGYKVLTSTKDTNREKHIILMSDGQMDLGNKERNLRLLEKTLENLAPQLAKENIKVHTIAFTEDSYIPLLKLTAEDTGGQFVLLKNADAVHQVFEHIFVRTKEPEEIPLKEDNFIVDENINELTIVASKYRPNSVISLESPSASDISKAEHDKNTKWFSAEKFDLITIKNPDPGYWLIKFSEGGNKAYILSNLSLVAETTKKVAEPGTPLHITAYLNKKGKQVTNKALLNSSSFKVKVTSPTGAVITNRMIDDGTEIGSERHDGIYGISYAFDNEGTYKIEVEVRNATFDRKKTLFIDVKSFQPKQVFVAKDVQAPPVETPIPEMTTKTEAADKQHTAESVDNEEVHKSTAPENNGQEMEAETATDEHATESNAAQDDSEKHDKGENENISVDGGDYSLKEAVIFFVMFNIILAAAGGGYYYYYRRKKQERSKDMEQQDTVKNPDAFNDKAVDLSETDDEEYGDMDEDHEAPDLESTAETAESTATKAESEAADELSDIDLEEELSSILESEESKKAD